MSLLKYLLIAGSIAFALQGWSAPVDANTAATAIKGWIQSEPLPLGATLGNQVGKVETHKDTNGAPLYYVVHLKPTGIVIVSADDQAEPVVAFASQNTFDPSTKSPLGALLSRDFPRRIASARMAVPGNILGAKNKNKWSALQLAATSSATGLKPNSIANNNLITDRRVDPLIQTAWNQATTDNTSNGPACYNYFTPPHESGNPNNAVCGCVATAMAQLMFYHKFPVNGVGTASFTFSFDNHPAQWPWPLRGGDGFGGPYQWTNMPLSGPAITNLTQRMAIGALTFDAGISVHMAYSDDTSLGSTASLLDAKTALLSTFMYGNAIIAGGTNMNVGYGLLNIINPNLDAHFPVVLSINNLGGGHCIICDGYGYNTATLYHHLNMGWGGSDNAWYHLPFIDLPDVAPYYNIDGCLYNIYPTGGGEIISGRILATNGHPVAGTSVVATNNIGESYSAITDQNGIYALTGLPFGSLFTIIATNNGYFPSTNFAVTGISLDYNPNSGNAWGVNFVQLQKPTPLTLTTQPQSQSVTSGSGVSFTNLATGAAPIFYQWQYQTNGGSTWANMFDNGVPSGSTNPVLTINPVSLSMNGEQFRCVVTNISQSVTSSPAILTVQGYTFSIITQPTNQTVILGTAAAFSVLAYGSPPLYYQWQVSTNGNTNWNNLADDVTYTGSQTNYLSITPTTLAMNNESFRCVVSDHSSNVTNTTPATLTITGLPPSFTLQPATAKVFPGTMVTFSVMANGTLVSYQWQYHSNGTSTWTNVVDNGVFTGSQSPNLSINSAALNMNGDWFQCLASNNWGVTNSLTAQLSVTIDHSTPISLSTLAGTAQTNGSADGTNAMALFNNPHGVAVDSQTNVFVADTGNNVIRKLVLTSAGWSVSTIAGSATSYGTNDGPGASARFNGPIGIAIGNNTNLYVTDAFNQTIRKLTPSSTNWTVSTIAGQPGNFGTNDGISSLFKFPMGIACDTTGTTLFVADEGNHTIRRLVLGSGPSSASTIAGTAGVMGTNDGYNNSASFGNPYGITVDSAGVVYVTDQFFNTIRTLTPNYNYSSWQVTTIAGQSSVSGPADGTSGSARFYQPTGIFAASDGYLYVADFGNNTLRRMVPLGSDWVVYTVAGFPGIAGSVDGTGTNALLNKPFGIAMDNSTNIFVADSANNTIRGTALLPIPNIVNFSYSKAARNFQVNWCLNWTNFLPFTNNIQFKTNLTQSAWIKWTNLSTTCGSFMISNETQKQMFYRVGTNQ